MIPSFSPNANSIETYTGVHKKPFDSDKEMKRPIVQAGAVGEEEIKDVFIPPDGGYGWFIAFGTFLALFWTAGMIKSYGVIFDRYSIATK